jgi:hypothetical protein
MAYLLESPLSIFGETQDGTCVNFRRRSRMYRLDNDQLNTLVAIVREQRGDKLSRAEFTDAMLLLFENIAGFETLPRRLSQRYMKILWQSYETARRAPTRGQRNRQ